MIKATLINTHHETEHTVKGADMDELRSEIEKQILPLLSPGDTIEVGDPQ